MSKDGENTLVSFMFTPEALKQIDELKVILKEKDRAQVVRAGLRALQWLIELDKKDGNFVLIWKGDIGKKLKDED